MLKLYNFLSFNACINNQQNFEKNHYRGMNSIRDQIPIEQFDQLNLSYDFECLYKPQVLSLYNLHAV